MYILTVPYYDSSGFVVKKATQTRVLSALTTTVDKMLALNTVARTPSMSTSYLRARNYSLQLFHNYFIASLLRDTLAIGYTVY